MCTILCMILRSSLNFLCEIPLYTMLHCANLVCCRVLLSCCILVNRNNDIMEVLASESVVLTLESQCKESNTSSFRIQNYMKKDEARQSLVYVSALSCSQCLDTVG